MSDMETTANNQKPKRVRQPERVHIAQAVVGLVEAFRRCKPTGRLLATVARSLERDGDAEGAAIVAALGEKNDRGFGPRHWESDKHDAGLRWFDGAAVDLVLRGDAQARLERMAEEFAAVREFVTCGIDPPTRAMFVGPSGTGKTLAARWLGWRLCLPVAVVELDVTSKGIMGATAEAMAKHFEAAVAVPSILFIDEIDAMGMPREAGHKSSGSDIEQARITSALLQRLDWLPPTQIVI